jgi:nucleoside-diphosphate-sugar epimerase
MRFYTTGVTGYIGVKDVVIVMRKLMQSTIVNERYILVSEHLSFNTFLTKIADVLGVKPPSVEAKKWLLVLASCLDRLRSFVTRQPRVLNKSIVKSSQNKTEYNTIKFEKDLQIELENITTVIYNTGKLFKYSAS